MNFSSMRNLLTCSKKGIHISQQNTRIVFSSGNWALGAIGRREEKREPKRNVPIDDYDRLFFIPGGRDVLLRWGIFYCSSGQMDLSEVFFAKAKISGKKSETRRLKNRGFFCESDGNPITELCCTLYFSAVSIPVDLTFRDETTAPSRVVTK